MIRRLLILPLVLVLSLKLSILRFFLRLAREDVKDAKEQFCATCSPKAGDCQRPAECAIQRFKHRETVLANAVGTLEDRFAAFVRG